MRVKTSTLPQWQWSRCFC